MKFFALNLFIILAIFSTVTPLITFLLYKHFKIPAIQICKAQLTDNGKFIDIRFNILKPKRLGDIQEIYLVDESTGLRLDFPLMPKLGKLHKKSNQGLSPSHLLLSNKNMAIKPYGKVTLCFGEYEVKHIEVKSESIGEKPNKIHDLNF